MSDFQRHPAIIMTVPYGHKLGKAGLDAIFTEGSLWHYGPAYENCEPLHRVTAKGAYQAPGLLDYNQPGNPSTWFIDTECLSTPFSGPHSRNVGQTGGIPPCAMIPAAAIRFERNVLGLKPGEAPGFEVAYPAHLFTPAVTNALVDNGCKVFSAPCRPHAPQCCCLPACQRGCCAQAAAQDPWDPGYVAGHRDGMAIERLASDALREALSGEQAARQAQDTALKSANSRARRAEDKLARIKAAIA